MYDLNGLELSKCEADHLNSYRFTAVDLRQKKFTAYAFPSREYKNQFTMLDIGLYADPRDAAFVAQEFNKKYSRTEIRQMHKDGIFREVANEFKATIEIPEWKYPAEGMTIDEMLGTPFKKNYVDNSRDALLEALQRLNKKTPPLAVAKAMMATVDKMVAEDKIPFRRAALAVVEKM